MLIRLHIVDNLKDAGLNVLEATNADDAIEILASRDDIQLVFTDVNMPGSMDGIRLAAYVRDRWPPIKLIVTSGKVPVKQADLPQGARFFGKPYEAPQIIQAVTEMFQ
jgi:CheY-like chemotaxis protein